MRKLILIALVAYLGGYVAFRQINNEVWAKDGRAYVIFPTGTAGLALYYLFRPLSYADERATGMRAHIGPHR